MKRTTKAMPNRAVLNSIFKYHEKGYVSYRHSRAHTTIQPGDKVGCLDKGYLIAKIGGQNFALHRIIWKMHYGTEPKYVDHRDRNPLNNRIENLRPATNGQNKSNSLPKGKYKGVYPNRDRGNFVAKITADKRTRQLGVFDTEEEAARAYDTAARQLLDIEFAYLNFPEVEDYL